MKILKYIGIFLLFFVIAIGIVLLIAPKQIEYSTETTINAPQGQVWASLTNPEKMGKWMKGFVSIKHISGEPGMAGSKSEMTFSENGQNMVMQETIHSVSSGESMDFTVTMPDVMEMDIRIELESTGPNTTILKSSSKARALRTMMRLFLFSNKSFVERDKEDYTRFKEWVESSD